MARSPKRQDPNAQENLRAKRPKKEEQEQIFDEEEPAFEIGGGNTNESASPENTDFSTNMPTPFDNIVEDPVGGASLPESASPTTNLVQTTNSNSQSLKDVDDKKRGRPSGSQTQNTKVNSTGPKKSVMTQSSASAHHPNTQQAQSQNQQAASSKMQTDPDKLSDALFSAGVDIREEEALLNSSMNITKSSAQAGSQAVNNQIPPQPPLLHPTHVASFMKKVGSEQNFNQDFSKSHDVLSLMSTACEVFMTDIITNSLVISRHRRRSIKLNSGRRSEVSRALRDLAIHQKEQEERRVKRRIAMGLEKETAEAKMETEETLHRASNATANMMIAGGKKKYSWLNAGAKANNNSVKVLGKVSSDVAARGEMGIRYREAREEPGIVMRDLLNALENRRVGVNTVVAKGYARIRD
ncbi:TBP-associated factor 4 [Lachancea thermotolerans]